MLRTLFASLTANNGLLYDEEGRSISFYGEAMEYEDGTGLLTNGEQGIFRYQRDEGGSVVISSYEGAGKVSHYGLFAYAQGNENRFHKVGSYYAPELFDVPPLMEGILHFFDPKIDASYIEDFTLEIRDAEVVFTYRYEMPSSAEPCQRNIHLVNIGKMCEQEICNYLLYPVMQDAPTSFSPSFLSKAEEWTLGEGLPFPMGITHAFKESQSESKLIWKAHGADLRSSYQIALKGYGYVEEEGRFKKAFLLEGSKITLSISLCYEGGWTICEIEKLSRSIETPNFIYINNLLKDWPIPVFPASSDVISAMLLEGNDSRQHIEIVFKARELGVLYFEGPYADEARHAGYAFEGPRLEKEGYMVWTSIAFRIEIDRGTLAPESGFPYRVMITRLS